MNFTRVTRGDVVAAVAALALLLVLSVDWYTTTEGRDLRRIEQNTQPQGGQGGEVSRFADREADRIATNAEQTAWQADEAIDRFILVVLLSAALLGTAAVWLRAADVRFTPPWTPSAAATVVGLAGALLVAFRIAEKPATDAAAVVKLGAPLGLVCVGVMAIGARAAWRSETERAREKAADRPTPQPALAGVAAGAGEPASHLWSEDESPDEVEWSPVWDEAQRDADTDENDALGTADFEAVEPGPPASKRSRSASRKRRAKRNQKRRRR